MLQIVDCTYQTPVDYRRMLYRECEYRLCICYYSSQYTVYHTTIMQLVILSTFIDGVCTVVVWLWLRGCKTHDLVGSLHSIFPKKPMLCFQYFYVLLCMYNNFKIRVNICTSYSIPVLYYQPSNRKNYRSLKLCTIDCRVEGVELRILSSSTNSITNCF